MSAEEDREPVSAVSSQATISAGAVFLSYASEDAAAAERIAAALRAAGVEVWFDKSELRGGDAWDRQIREQIHDCRLFIPVISANSERRDEGYFRREWALAADRTRDMAHKRAFLVPVVIDGTPERGASVPDKFHELHWTRLPGGETPPAFIERIQRLLVSDGPARPAAAASTPSGSTIARASIPSPHPTRASNIVLWVISALLAMGLTYLIAERLWRPQHSHATPATPKTASSTSATPSTAAAFNPPPHSIAVLPFVNMSGDPNQQYFSDGLTEELLNSLSRINELQVAARTSSFSFQGEHPDIATVAHRLNVAAVLEGSVRRSAHTVRVTAQLVNGGTGYHLWSQTYDRDLGDVLALQAEIATAVASALKVTLLGDVAAKIELGGTRNPAALDAYLRGTRAHFTVHDRRKDEPAAIAAYTEAISLDPNYALAYAGRSMALGVYAGQSGGATLREFYDKALADAHQAIALAPELADGHMALGRILTDQGSSFDFARARDELKQALALAPGNARVSRAFGLNAVYMGHFDEGIAAIRRSIVLDPLNPSSQLTLGNALLHARRYGEAVTAFDQAISLDREDPESYGNRGLAYYALGDYQSARSSCEAIADNEYSEFCLAVTYDKLGQHTDARAMLAKFRARYGDAAAYQYAGIYAQWGDRAKALEWLEAAWRLRDGGLFELKTDAALDPLRNEPRFQAIERALKFPD
jgi:TolB-like protein/Tfp pilus assembly protein PilF